MGKSYASALLLVVLACPSMPQALDSAKAGDKANEKSATASEARSAGQSSWLQQQFPEFSSWLLQKLLDDSLELFAFACCVCWVCTHASGKFFGDKAHSEEFHSEELCKELLPICMLVLASAILFITLGAAASLDASMMALLLLPVLCSVFGFRRCPALLKWLLCCGLFLQVLHHGVEHVHSRSEANSLTSKSLTSADSRVSSLTARDDVMKKKLRAVTDSDKYQEDASLLSDRTRRRTERRESQEEVEQKEVSMLKSMLDVQDSRIQAMTGQISLLEKEKEIQARTIQALTERNEYLEHDRISSIR